MKGASNLKEYTSKRNFEKTPEPRGSIGTRAHSGTFTVQMHGARRLHYDFRLELDGVLKSWAVPKGPSLDPSIKRLAVRTEDHPLDYADFEGNIPAGQYGGGPVLLWDLGKWKPLDPDPVAALKNGHLKFQLNGKKLNGVWNLVRMHDGDKNWLLICDNAADEPLQEDITATKPRSVLSGRTLDDIRHDKKLDIQSTRSRRFKLPPEARKAAFPDSISPQLATLVDGPPETDDWLHELKFDGYRLICFINKGEIKIQTRGGHDWTAKFPRLSASLRKLPAGQMVLDGEVVALNQKGLSDFNLLQNCLNNQVEHDTTLYLYLFDLLYINGFDLVDCKLIDRKALLEDIINDLSDRTPIRYSQHVLGHASEVYANSCDFGLEGIVSKKIDSTYAQKRTNTWVKSKCQLRQEFIVIGFSQSPSSRRSFGALHLAYYNDEGDLTYAGKVGTGFNATTFEQFDKMTRNMKTKKSPPIKIETRPGLSKSRWFSSMLVAEVAFSAWTKDGRLRHAVFKGFRTDKTPAEIKEEKPMPLAKKSNEPVERVAGTEISNPEKILFPKQGIRKIDLVRYYEQIASTFLPQVEKRLLSLVRCPSGIDSKCFFQRHQQSLANDGIHLFDPDASQTKKGSYIWISRIEGLIHLVQNGTLEFHTWSARIDRINRPDQIIFDLDPGPGISWKNTIEAATHIRSQLDKLGLQSFARTTGGKGIHVVIPIERRGDFDKVAAWAKAFAEYMVHLEPDSYVANMSKSKRSNRVFIDYLRNKKSATAIASYSTRAREHCTVATPVSWEELLSIDNPADFNISTLPNRLRKLSHDPWALANELRQSLTKQMQLAMQDYL